MYACWRLITCAKPEPPDQREFYIDNRENRADTEFQPFDYADNVITSSRYTIWNFLPNCLFEQFQRIANFYFILVMLVQLLIDSPVNPLTTVIPIVFVISISVIKQGVEDILRHRSDNEVNKRKILVLRDNRFINVDSSTIHVGDVIKCASNSAFPCDMVLLGSSESSGECAVTTANLDGETSLKIFTALSETQILDFESSDSLQGRYLKVTCTQPIEDLYTFHGKLEISGDKLPQSYPLSAKNLLLRGAVMKNTEYVIGVATYTGYDTKLSLNSKGKKTKYSQVELKLNHFLIIYFAMLFAMSIVCVVLLYVYRYLLPSYAASWYIPKVTVTPWRTTQEIFAFIVLYNYLVPISLYVTIELQKFFGAFLFRYDLEMYDPLGNNRARVNTSDLNEELGQITYLFSDKTGTLTENDMQFRRCSIGGVRHIDIDGQLCKMAPNSNEDDINEDNDEVVMDELLLIPYSKTVTEFLVFMSLCHTVRVEREVTTTNTSDEAYLGPLLTEKNRISHDGMDYDYQASSPDEKAFLEACRRYGIVYHGLLEGFHCVSLHKGDLVKYKIHEVFEFDSDRKCMSVLVEYPDGSFRFMCKGAESSMLPKAGKFTESVQNDVIMEHLMEYAENGLRTLVFGYKDMSVKEAHALIEEVSQARKSLGDSERLLVECYTKFESDLVLIGCTGIEDRLQEGVKDTLVDLRAAGIKVWVLTGDKEETAVNISYSAGHFQHDCMQEIRLTKLTSGPETNRALENALERIETASNIQPNASYCLVVDGQALKFLMEPALEDQFLELCQQVSTVLCCRMTPLQKAEIVRMVKLQQSSNGVTAAIGDGGNDVSMIQEAHVGLGIFGKEGRQAVRASDYAFGKFRFVRRALLLHGHFFYTRITNLIHYFFYKNLVFIMPQFFYSFVSLHSQTTIYYFYVLMLFNVTFTTLPILIYGIWEQSIPASHLSTKPILYRVNRNNRILNMKNFFIWNFFGLYHSLVIFLCCYGISLDTDSIMGSQGHSNDYLMFGMTVFFCVWFIVTIKLYLSSYFLHWVAFVGFLIILICNIVLFIIFTVTPYNYDFFGLLWSVWGQPSYWLQIFLVCVLALAPDIVYKVFRDRTLKRLLTVPSTRHKKPRRRVSYVPGLTKNQPHDNDEFTIHNTLKQAKKKQRQQNGQVWQNGDISTPATTTLSRQYDNIGFQ